MPLLALQNRSIPLIMCGIFYAVLCIFSIVTGIMYLTAQRELNPLELSDSFVDCLESKNKLTFFTEVTLPLRRGHPYVEDEGMLAEPIIGLQYRCRISSHWYFDASAAYAWNRHAPYARMTDRPFRLTLFAHWLPNERWMFSAGLDNSLDNSQGLVEALWQTNDRLQLKAQMHIEGGINTSFSTSSIYGLIGFNWMIR